MSATIIKALDSLETEEFYVIGKLCYNDFLVNLSANFI